MLGVDVSGGGGDPYPTSKVDSHHYCPDRIDKIRNTRRTRATESPIATFPLFHPVLRAISRLERTLRQVREIARARTRRAARYSILVSGIRALIAGKFCIAAPRANADQCTAAGGSVNDQYLRSPLDVDVYLLSLSLGN